jgi:hypothetical protein
LKSWRCQLWIWRLKEFENCIYFVIYLYVFKLVCTRWENFITIGITVLYSLIRLNWVNLEYNGYYTRLIVDDTPSTSFVVLVLFVMFLLTPFFIQYITSDITIQSVLVTLHCWNRHFTFTVILTDKIIRKKKLPTRNPWSVVFVLCRNTPLFVSKSMFSVMMKVSLIYNRHTAKN